MAAHSFVFSHSPSCQDHVGPSTAASGDTKRTLSLYSIVAAITLLFTLLYSSPQAFAATTHSQVPLWSCGTPSSGHCYGSTYWGGANGADTRISLNTSLNGGGTTNDYYNYSFVTTEMWIAQSNAAYWVEVGVISEFAAINSTNPFYFWADQRPNGGGFSFHMINGIPGNGQSPLFRIVRASSSSWNVLVQDNSSTYTATSTSNNFTAGYIQLGTELYNNYQTAYEPYTYYIDNRWWNGNTFIYQGNDGIGTNIGWPVSADWYPGLDPLHSSNGGTWYSCITSAGC